MTADQIKVSVIVPVYNAQDFIEECYQSILSQTFPVSQIIFVDNNSKDKSLDLLNQFSLNDKRVIVLQEQKQGASAARNKGLSLADGDYIQFLDADDLLEEDKIKHQIEIILYSDNKPDVVAAAYWRVQLKTGDRRQVKMNISDPWLGLLESRLGCTCSNLWRREKLLQVDAWDEKMSSSQEYDLMFRLMKSDAKLKYDFVPKTIVRERTSGNISSVNVYANLINYCELRIRIIDFLKETGYFKYEYYQILFDCFRLIYPMDKKLALKLFRDYLPVKFQPEESPVTTKLYVMLFRLFGFSFAENLKILYRSVKA